MSHNEPWKVFVEAPHLGSEVLILANTPDEQIVTTIEGFEGHDGDKANATRIVACVNFCAGADNQVLQSTSLRLILEDQTKDVESIQHLRAQLAEARADANRTAQILKAAERDYLARIEFLKEQLTEAESKRDEWKRIAGEREKFEKWVRTRAKCVFPGCLGNECICGLSALLANDKEAK